MLPVHAGDSIRKGLTEYLATSFSLADNNTAKPLTHFLEDPEKGIFHGPYVKTRLPYAPAEDWKGLLDFLPPWFVPYYHQAQAFRRLSSKDSAPEPTLVVTGTGSGKTESFLYPILDHARRERGQGKAGVKAIIIYPMNALANDQAKRLAELLDSSPELSAVTAGIYTGDSGLGGNRKMTADSLITSRAAMRDDPPDILLTNYKMLDLLLLRPEDRNIWVKSATSLRYLVLDEFHTYDGAQGTDVALLLRRLGLVLKSLQPEGFLASVGADPQSPLGAVVPVATSATLGDKSDVSPILNFAETVFGTKFKTSSVVTEKQLDIAGWQNHVLEVFSRLHLKQQDNGDSSADGDPDDYRVEQTIRRLRKLHGSTGPLDADTLLSISRDVRKTLEGSSANYAESVFDQFVRRLFNRFPDSALASLSLTEIVIAYCLQPTFARLLEVTATSRPLGSRESEDVDCLVTSIFNVTELRTHSEESLVQALTDMLTFMAALRAKVGAEDKFLGKQLPGVEAHLWVRELSRIDRAVANSTDPTEQLFRFSDDGPVEKSIAHTWLAACYCRTCGRSGWMASLEPGTDSVLVTDPNKVRQLSVTQTTRQRPLLDATNEQLEALRQGISVAGATSSDARSAVQWFDPAARVLIPRDPPEDDESNENNLPVLTYCGPEADKDAEEGVCPSCLEADSIRFLGSRVATLLSVSLSNLFGMPELDREEKKTLVFADSVQDAAHRAGFVHNRARAFTLRTMTRQAVGDEPVALSEIPGRLMEAAKADPRARFELLPPEIAHSVNFEAYWRQKTTPGAYRSATFRVAKRLAFDMALEFGDRADLARSLVLTGALSVEVAADDRVLEKVAREALGALEQQPMIADESATYITWAHGILETIRSQGGINHPWLRSYLVDDGNTYMLYRREARADGVPAFPKGGYPRFPVSGRSGQHKNSGLVPVTAANGRYARWTRRLLGLSGQDAAQAVTNLLFALAEQGILTAVQTKKKATVFAIEPEKIIVHPTDNEDLAVLVCSVCHSRLGVSTRLRQMLAGSPCQAAHCQRGVYQIEQIEKGNYYKRLYETKTPRTVIANEHTALLDGDERQRLEKAFSSGDDEPDSPNVLVATPTLEMGIDIGDLSTVMLASLPATVANYVQRVGRAGRLTGNSLAVALVRGRGSTLPKIKEPLSVIEGQVLPPTAYLNAREILHRQFLAHLLDVAVDPAVLASMSTARDVFQSGREQQPLIDIIAATVKAGVDAHIDSFTAALGDKVENDVAEELRCWVNDNSDGLIFDLEQAQLDWITQRARLLDRLGILSKRLDELDKQLVASEVDDETRRDRNSTYAAKKLAKKELDDTIHNENWIGSMERFGLLPNFTLVDDNVELALGISEYDLQSTDFQVERREYSRGVSAALHEFAPGATFYAQGIAAQIDSVEIGHQGSDIQRWRICPECSYAANTGNGPQTSASACPRCSAGGFADDGQVIPVVPLRKVSAQVDRTRANISDIMDERRQTYFHAVLTADIDPKQGTAWFNQEGFGAHYLPHLDITWLNLGKGDGEKLLVAGKEQTVPYFPVCRYCGHLDSKARSNSWRDHAPWCVKRHSRDEETERICLSRSLRTQAVVLYIPPLVTATATSALPSLVAAVKLGLKKILGSDPEHIDIAPLTVPAVGGGAVDALLIHDSVPGGTGYLTQLSDAESVWKLLYQAWEVVSTCGCKEKQASGCPECLLPYAYGRNADSLSRASAEESLLKILTATSHPEADATPEFGTWELRDSRPRTSAASQLELRFRELFNKALTDRRYTITERSSGRGFTFKKRGQPGYWTLTEQKNLGTTVPDFYLEHQSSDIPDIAVYLDGKAFHTGANYRVDDDFEKRSSLKEHDDIIPWSLTSADLDDYEHHLGRGREVTRASVTPVQRQVLSRLSNQHQIPTDVGLFAFRDSMLQLLQLIDLLQEDKTRQYLPVVAEASFGSVLEQCARQHQLKRSTVGVEALVKADDRSHYKIPPEVDVIDCSEFGVGDYFRIRMSNTWADIELLPPPPAAPELDTYTDNWHEFLRLTNTGWLMRLHVAVKAHQETVVCSPAPQQHPMVSPESTAPIALDSRVDVIGGVLAQESPVADHAGDASDMDEDWKAVLDEFEDEDDIVDALTALARSGQSAPDLIGEEIGGIPTLVGWSADKTLIVEDATDIPGSLPAEIAEWTVEALGQIAVPGT
nr:DEAD/DEAH box helicase [Corynebacterium mendelii]